MRLILNIMLQALFILPVLADSAKSASFDWRKELLIAERQLASPRSLTRDNCAHALRAWTDRLADVPSSELMPSDEAGAADLATHGSEWLERFFRVRTLLKRRWNALSTPSEACEQAVRRALRYSRFAEDFLAEWLYSRGDLKSLPQTMFGGGAPHTLVASGAAPLRIESGDILVMRGPNFGSSFLARVGNEEGDFSHLAIVARDESGRKYIVEALIREGTLVVPLADYLRDKKEWRVTLLRYHNRAVADRAGLEIFRRTRGVLEGTDSIPYNYSFNLSDDRRFYCAQVASYAFGRATGGNVSLPEFHTRLGKFGDSAIARSLNIQRTEVFAPSDIQIDRRFDIVAEFRDPALLQETRHANVAMARLLAWLRDGYELKPQPINRAIASVLLPIFMDGKNDRALTAESAAMLLEASDIFGRLAAAATAIDIEAVRKLGHPLTFRELEAELDRMRPIYQAEVTNAALH